MNATVSIATKGENYISIVIEDVTELKSEYDIISDVNIFTIGNKDIKIIGNENKIIKIEKWGNGSLKELHNNCWRKDNEDV